MATKIWGARDDEVRSPSMRCRVSGSATLTWPRNCPASAEIMDTIIELNMRTLAPEIASGRPQMHRARPLVLHEFKNF